LPANSTMNINFQSKRDVEDGFGWTFFSQHWLIWLGGLIFSILPLFVIVIFKYVGEAQYNTFEEGWIYFWGNREIFYIYVSLTVAAFLGLLVRSGRADSIKLAQGMVLLVIMLVAAMLYILLTYNEINGPRLVNLNLILLGITFVFGTSAFIDKIKRES